MGWVASFFSGLKAEVEWLITSLAVATGNSDAATPTQTADGAGTAHHHDAAPTKDITIATLADQQADSAASDHHQIASNSDASNPGSDPQLANTAPHSAANLLLNADFLSDTTDHSGPAPSPGLTPISFEAGVSGLSGLSALVAPSADRDFSVTLPGNGMHAAISTPHPDAGEFALASLAPQSSDFSKGGNSGGNNNGGTYSGTNILSGPNGASSFDSSGNPIGSGLHITLRLDNSVVHATTADYATQIAPDLQAVADFFTHTYTNNISVAINVGWGEVNNSNLSGALGESISNYVQVKAATGSDEYHTVASAYSGITYNEGGTTKAIAPVGDVYSGTQQWWLTSADLKALNLQATAALPSTDGSVGFANAAGTWYFGGGSAPSNTYDFQSVVAHEISEVLGRQTWNGVHSGGARIFQPLDLFHFADGSTGSQIYAGSAAGFFSVDGTNDTADGYKEFNTVSGGDHSDWAVASTATTADAYDWSGGQGEQGIISYADYLVMEAVGYHGNFTGTESGWSSTI